MQLGAALAGSCAFALFTGAISLRTRGVYFIMITLAFGQMLFFLAISLAAYGGEDGLTLAARSTVFGAPVLKNNVTLYYVAFGALLLFYLLIRSIAASRFGRVLRGIKDNRVRMEAIGFAPYRYQLAAYVIAGMIAGIAGWLLANQVEFISPAYGSWQRSGELIFMVVLGGLGSLHGAIIGAAVFTLLVEMLSQRHRIFRHDLWPHSHRHGAVRARRSRWPVEGPAMSTPILTLEHVRKSYGALRVTDDVSLEIAPRELHAIIGPNGAGKTTLVHQISGLALPDSGRIVFDGQDVTKLPLHARARLGLVRSFQIVSILPGFSVLENVAMAAQAHAGSSFRFVGNAAAERPLNDAALELLTRFGLAARASVLAGLLSHGEKRQLELAVAIASKPRLLLLDEPLAGTSHEESRRVVEILQALKHDLPIILIEHDMEAVFALADRVSVLVYGRIIASGTPESVRGNAEVRAAYLGEETIGEEIV